MIVVLMGVCGCGKTTVGHALAGQLAWPFHDADGFHPPANVAKMAFGIPLTDDDRWPWLDRIAAEMGAINAAGGHAVLACSALKQAYRDRIAKAGDVRFVFLKGDHATIAVATRDAAARVHAGVAAAEPVRHARGADRRARRRHPRRRRHAGRRDPPRLGARHRDAAHEVPQSDGGAAISVATPRRFLGAINTPVFRATTILFPKAEDLEQAYRGEYPHLHYGLHGLPTVVDLQNAIAALEGGHAALAVPSGLTATTFPLLALAKAGDHVLVTDVVYGPTRRFCDNHLRRLGVDVSYYDPLLGRRHRA